MLKKQTKFALVAVVGLLCGLLSENITLQDVTAQSSIFDSNYLIYTQGDTIMRLDASGTTELATNVIPSSLLPSPNNPSHFIFADERDASSMLNHLDTNSGTWQPIGVVGGNNGGVIAWSPNGEWIIVKSTRYDDTAGIVNDIIGIYHIEDGLFYELSYFLGDYQFFWLESNQLLHFIYLYGYGNETEGQLRNQSLSVFVVDLISSERVDLPINESIFSNPSTIYEPSRWSTLSSELEAFGYSLDAQYDIYNNRIYHDGLQTYISIEYPDVPRNFPPTNTCHQWSVVQKPIQQAMLPQQYYADSDVTYLSNLDYLYEQDSVLFLSWQTNGCIGIPNTHLETSIDLIISDETQTRILGENIHYPFGLYTSSLFYPLPADGRYHPYDISPDEESVIWLNADETTRTSRILMTDIESTETGEVHAVSCSNAAFATCRIDNVFWVPSTTTP